MCEYEVSVGGIQQGWQCPVCKRVYAPSTPMCYYCGGDSKTVNVDSTGTGSPIIDWARNISTTYVNGSSKSYSHESMLRENVGDIPGFNEIEEVENEDID